ncbi:hypothetical protein [Paenibacillus bouchesdurhonensis]|uniref:hypothetical protein n=1 Tax=Paenibacillus bouchesdurhonensis TaxID=1870990 RepID=UPI000DA60F7C|nr:hypothetical protein [Paenibacillus bouchesdurhonensis]
MIDRKEVVQKLAKDLVSSMREYQASELRDPDYSEIKEYNLLDGLEETIFDMNHRGGIYSEYKLDMTAVTYWKDIITAKIEVIGIVG